MNTLHPVFAQALAPFMQPVATSFNDDDAYVYDAVTKQIVRSIGCNEQEVIDARYIGLRVQAGQAWAKGLTAKRLGLWGAA